MPELPEVETIVQTLKKKILKKEIQKVNILEEKILSGKKAFLFQKKLIGKKFIDIFRRGKFLILTPHKGNFYIIVHLKMTGQLFFVDKKKFFGGGDGEKINFKHIHIEIIFKDKTKLFFSDIRKFGFWKIIPQKSFSKTFAHLGIEPLSVNFTFKNFQKLLRPQKNIKSFLLDQSFIAGIGNLYADEILFACKINPHKKISELNLKNQQDIFKNIKKILRKAIKYRGTTFNSFRDGENQKGNFQQFLKVYGRFKKKCFCCGKILKKVRLAGRGTTFCENCQR